jgi:SMP-30/Gluconolactonase/LRE-like region
MNDTACDPQGRFWAGTLADDHHARGGALYRLDPHGLRARFTKEPQLATVRIYTLSVRRGSWFRSWGTGSCWGAFTGVTGSRLSVRPL